MGSRLGIHCEDEMAMVQLKMQGELSHILNVSKWLKKLPQLVIFNLSRPLFANLNPWLMPNKYLVTYNCNKQWMHCGKWTDNRKKCYKWVHIKNDVKVQYLYNRQTINKNKRMRKRDKKKDNPFFFFFFFKCWSS